MAAVQKQKPAQRPKPKRAQKPARPRWLKIAAGAALAVVLLVALHRPLLRAVGGLLVVEDPPERADLIFLLNGAIETRAFHAAEVYGQGLAPRVVIAEAEGDGLADIGVRKGWTQLSVETLRMLGVPASAIEVLPVEGGTSSTQDEARALADYLQRHSARRILVVTSDYHTWRTRWTLRRELGEYPVDLRMTPAPSDFDMREWWRTEEGFAVTLVEFLKILHTWARG